MYSWTARLNAIFTFVTTVAGILAAVHAASVLFANIQPEVAVFSAQGTVPAKLHRNPRLDGTHITFDLDADFSKVWNWNVKLIFVSVSVEYETSSREKNQVVIWDSMIKKQSDAHVVHRHSDPIPLRSTKGNPFFYPVFETDGIKDAKNTSLHLRWSLMPLVGPIWTGERSAVAIAA